MVGLHFSVGDTLHGRSTISISPRLNHICVWPAGPRPSHASFTVRFSCLYMRRNFSPLGTNVTIPDHNYKSSSWHHFHSNTPKLIDKVPSQVNESEVNLNICNYGWALSHWLPTRRSSHASVRRTTGRWRRRGRGATQPAEHKCDPTWGLVSSNTEQNELVTLNTIFGVPSVEQVMKHEDAVQSLSNTCFYDVCS